VLSGKEDEVLSEVLDSTGTDLSHTKAESSEGCWWIAPVILGSWETEIGRFMV
jgi:hypothetical protein